MSRKGRGRKSKTVARRSSAPAPRAERAAPPALQQNFQFNQYQLGFPVEQMGKLRETAPELYECILNGMTSEQDHRFQMDRAALAFRGKFSRRAQLFSGILGLLYFAALLAAIYYDRQWIGGFMGVGAVGALLRAVWGKFPWARRDEDEPGNAPDEDE